MDGKKKQKKKNPLTFFYGSGENSGRSIYSAHSLYNCIVQNEK